MPHALAQSITEKLIRINTINPPGNEAEAVRLIAPLLQDAGFRLQEIPYGPNRSSLIASIGPADRPGVILSGHLDTVPLGKQPWTVPPFSAATIDNRLFGRGATDMKSGVAVLVASALHFADRVTRPLTLILSADEEVGCAGVAQIVRESKLPQATIVLVAEPTGNIPRLGHKGVFWLKTIFRGKTAHAAFPELGDNALIKAAMAVMLLNNGMIRDVAHPVMGNTTLVTSRFFSGENYNSVPDQAELGIDIRSTVNLSNSRIFEQIQEGLQHLSPEFEIVYDLPPLWTSPDSTAVHAIFDSCDRVRKSTHKPEIVTF